jgi:hypothetical protein
MNVGLHLTDLIVLCISLGFLAYSLYSSSDLSIQQSAFVPITHNSLASIYRNGISPDPSELSPLPLITDLEGDNLNEIICVTREPRLRAYRYDTSRKKYFLERDVAIASELAVSTKGRQAVGLASGYIVSYSETANREQIVVIVTENFQILAYNSKFDLMWAKTIAVDLSESYLTDVAILINSNSMRVEDTGSVIIGARLQHKAKLDKYHLHGETTVQEASGNEFPESNFNPEGTESLLHDGTERQFGRDSHYNYYAFDGLSGEERWKHGSQDFIVGSAEADLLHPQHDVHSGEVDWRNYRAAVVNSLPHSFTVSHDSALDLQHYERVRPGKEKKSKTAQKIKKQAQSSLFSADLSFRLRPHSDIEHIKQPNSVVAHLHGGIEVLHLFSGRPITKLALNNGELHADINGDGVIDHIMAKSGAQGHDFSQNFAPFIRNKVNPAHPVPSCLAVVTSGVPPRSQLFNHSLCNSNWGLFSFDFPATVKGKPVGGKVSAEQAQQANFRTLFATPISIKTAELSYNGLPQYQLFYFANSGTISSIAHDGKRGFTCTTRSNWLFNDYSEPSEQLDSNSEPRNSLFGSKTVDSEAALRNSIIAEYSFQPSIVPFALYSDPASTVEPIVDHVLACGQFSCSLVNLNGKLVQSVAIAGQPVARTVVADTNNDGLNDFIVLTSAGYYVYTFNQKVGSFLYTVLSLLLLALLLILIASKIASNKSNNFSRGIRKMQNFAAHLQQNGSGSMNGAATANIYSFSAPKRAIQALAKKNID